MTINDYATLRNISYDQAYRAAKHAILSNGRAMNKGRSPTEMQPDEVTKADEYRAKIGTNGRHREIKVDPQKIYEIQAREWIAQWGAKADPGVIGTEFCIIGILTVATGPEWFDEPRGVQRVGDLVLRIAVSVDVDWIGDDWSGFTCWLFDQGYRLEKTYTK